MIFISLGTVCA